MTNNLPYLSWLHDLLRQISKLDVKHSTLQRLLARPSSSARTRIGHEKTVSVVNFSQKKLKFRRLEIPFKCILAEQNLYFGRISVLNNKAEFECCSTLQLRTV